ncbi:hypothetical protein M9458_037186 [Cirrhinus mrigala]|uniref:Uncharacterized protein n=1 Tax=Cirrhinus mrigala TaxID=683832 RepID=A0ABD0P4E4_CIRMR
MSLSPYPHIQTVAPHPGLHSPSFSVIPRGSAPVTSQRRYKSPGLSPCKPRSIVVVSLVPSSLSVVPLPGHLISSICPEPRHVTFDCPRSRPIMMASVLDPPLASVRAANIPVASTPSRSTFKEVLPLATALPLMAVAIWCVWAAHCAPEVTSVHRSAPEVTPVHKSAPEVPSDHESAPEAFPVREAAPMPPEVSALAVEPLMEAALSFGLSASLLILSASSVPVFPRSQSMMRVPAPPWMAPAPPTSFPAPPGRAPAPPALAPPWRAPAPPAPPWRIPAPPALPPAPPWKASALPVLPQSPGPPTAPQDCFSVGASGSRSLGGGGGGYVMNLVGGLWTAHHQMSLSPYPHTQTVAPHPGLHSPSFSALIGSAPVTNQRRYKSPGLSPCKPRSIVVVLIIVSFPVFSSLAWPSRLDCLAACLLDSSSFIGLFSRLVPLRIMFAAD